MGAHLFLVQPTYPFCPSKFDSHSHSLQRTLGSTGTNQAQPPLSTQSSPGESPDITREDEQPPAYQENPVHGLPARPAHQAIDPEDADSVPDKGSKRSWSLHVFVLQMVVFFALTIVAILGYAGTLNLPSTSPEKNFLHYSSSVRDVFEISVAGMGPSTGLALFLLSLLSIP